MWARSGTLGRGHGNAGNLGLDRFLAFRAKNKVSEFAVSELKI